MLLALLGGGLGLLGALGHTRLLLSYLQGIDSQLQVLDGRTMADVVDASLVQERFVSHLAGLFSVSALLLAALGLTA